MRVRQSSGGLKGGVVVVFEVEGLAGVLIPVSWHVLVGVGV